MCVASGGCLVTVEKYKTESASQSIAFLYFNLLLPWEMPARSCIPLDVVIALPVGSPYG